MESFQAAIQMQNCLCLRDIGRHNTCKHDNAKHTVSSSMSSFFFMTNMYAFQNA